MVLFTCTHTHTHTEPLEFTATLLDAEYIQSVGEGITLRCSARGNPPPGQPTWLRNGVTVEAGGRVALISSQSRLRISNVQEEDAGIYQCLVAVDNQPATTIVQSGYLNVYCESFYTPSRATSCCAVIVVVLLLLLCCYCCCVVVLLCFVCVHVVLLSSSSLSVLRGIAIDPSAREIILELPNTPPTISLNCSVTAHPIPRLEWTRNGQPVVGQQAATGYMETPFSILTISTSELTNGVEVFACTANLETRDPISSTISIAAYCECVRHSRWFVTMDAFINGFPLVQWCLGHMGTSREGGRVEEEGGRRRGGEGGGDGGRDTSVIGLMSSLCWRCYNNLMQDFTMDKLRLFLRLCNVRKTTLGRGWFGSESAGPGLAWV